MVPSVSPISSTPLDSLTGVAPPTGTAAPVPKDDSLDAAASAINWLLTWIGQMEPETDTESGGTESESATVAQPVQWMTLLPAVPAFQPLFTEIDPGASTVISDLAATAASTEPSGLGSVPLTASSKEGTEAEELPLLEQGPPLMLSVAGFGVPAPSIETSLNPAEKSANTGEADIALTTAQPIAAASRGDALIEGDTTTNGHRLSLFSQPRQSLQPEVSLAPTALVPQDKGELIWTAELVVHETAPKTETKLEASLTATPDSDAALVEPGESVQQPASQKQPPSSGKSDLALGPIPGLGRAGTDRQSSADSREDPSSGNKQDDSASRQRKPVSGSTAREPIPTKDIEPAVTEFQEAPSSTAPTLGVGPTGSSSPSLPPKTAAVKAESTANIGAASFDTETPRTLRPAQVATLMVDVPAAAGADDSAPMRLAVSQRGAQVNVQLRSWDGATPLDNGRMEPLMQTLAEQGLKSAKNPVESIEESLPRTIEFVREKTIQMAETAAGGDGQQSFQNPDERQQKHQERQQHAFLMRRQLRNASAGSFDLGALTEAGANNQQQGALR